MIGNKEIDGMHKQLLTYFIPLLVLRLQWLQVCSDLPPSYNQYSHVE